MNLPDPQEIRSLLATPSQGAGARSDATLRRMLNIDWVRQLDRKGLCFQDREKQILIKTVDDNEVLYIQYPGKESIREGDKCRPWDFRPKVYMKAQGRYAKDLSFTNIWGQLIDELESYDEKRKAITPILSIMFYRMAFMVDHELKKASE